MTKHHNVSNENVWKTTNKYESITWQSTTMFQMKMSENQKFFRHFHLDHCGALPYMSEMVGFDGPIYMTHPTKAICPILLVWQI
jgi:predicted metal-dependent RNase